MLSVVRWDVFGTLTYTNAPGLECTVERHVVHYLEEMRIKMRLNRNEYCWFGRVERGEMGDRLHAHILVSVPKRWRGLWLVPEGCVSVAHRTWALGMTKFRAVCTDDPAVVYIVGEATNGADGYELQKTTRTLWALPSPALIRRALLQKSGG